jgi:hypothetical protein
MSILHCDLVVHQIAARWVIDCRKRQNYRQDESAFGIFENYIWSLNVRALQTLQSTML